MYGKQPRFLVVTRRVNSYYVFAGLNVIQIRFESNTRHLNVFVLCLLFLINKSR